MNELGRGRFSVVYRGRRDGRWVAVKLPVRAESATDSIRAARRFLREAVALARVRHPALPEVQEVGSKGQVPYLVLELVQGETLASRLARGCLTEHEAAAIGRDIAGALERIHSAGLVHRDVSAKNVLLDPATGSAKLVDFGFAVPVDASERHDYLGTPAYAAPEQQMRLGSRVDGRADLYSLGRVLADIVGLDRTDTAGRLSAHFTRIIERLTQTDPDDRYQAAGEVLLAFTALESDSVSDARAEHRIKRQLFDGLELWRPLRGRGAERALLERAWMDMQSLGGRTVAVIGPRGSGKSHLVHSFFQSLQTLRQRTLIATCREGAKEPFGVVRRLVEAYLTEVLRESERAAFWVRTRDVAPYLRTISPLFGRLFPEAAKELPTESDPALVERFAHLIQDLTSEEPTAVLIDDAQWLDASSRLVLRRVVQRAHHGATLFVLAGRSLESVEDMQPIGQDFRLLALEPLARADLVSIITDFLGSTSIDAVDADFLVGLGDATPWAAVELLRALLDSGALTPHWGTWRLDREQLSHARLPRTTEAVLERRLGQLESPTLDVLSAGAVLGQTFEDQTVAAIANLPIATVHAALAEARSAQIVAGLPENAHRFVHDGVREELLSRLSADGRRLLHQRAADYLNDQGVFVEQMERSPSSELQLSRTFAIAEHYIRGDGAANPTRALAACKLAARFAFQVYDNPRAIELFEAAGFFANQIHASLEPELVYLEAEAHRRVGQLERADALYTAVIATASPLLRARAWTRIAWIRMQLEREDTWQALEAAFKVLGVGSPARPVQLLGTSLWKTPASRRLSGTSPDDSRERRETLCALYYLASRIAINTNKPTILATTAIAGMREATRLGPSASLVSAYLIHAILNFGLGRNKQGRTHLARAFEMSESLGDPGVIGRYYQVSSVASAFAGDFESAIASCQKGLGEYAPWIDANEYCLLAHVLSQLEGMRGHSGSAWKWLDRAIAHITLLRGSPVVLDFLEQAARASLTALGREVESDAVLGPLRKISLEVPRRGFFSQLNYGSLVRIFTERGYAGPELEKLVDEVRAQKIDPRRAHPAMGEYYVHLAHARVHACLRVDSARRDLGELRRAYADLLRAARLPLYKAHAVTISAYLKFFEGDCERALGDLGRAEAMATRENAPWLLYQVHRGRAHIYRSLGNEEAAHDHAKIAETLAREHSSAYRLRWIREEFRLERSRRDSSVHASESATFASTVRTGSSGRRGRGFLQALLRISRAPARDLEPSHQARLVVDELVHALRAERGFLLLSNEDRATPGAPTLSDLRVHAARAHDGAELADSGSYDTSMVAEVLARDPDDADDAVPHVGRSLIAADLARAKICAPLAVGDEVIGAVYLDRPLRDGMFNEADGNVLWALAAQIPVAFELARELGAREQRAEMQRVSHKVQSIQQMASGVAHDFKNMLAAVRAITETLLHDEELPSDIAKDMRTIEEASVRAETLSKQLMLLSTGDLVTRKAVDINQCVRELEPTLAMIIGSSARLVVELESNLPTIDADGPQIDQVITNLVLNARDAMPDGGTIRVRTSRVWITGGNLDGPESPPTQRVRLTVSDDGSGMDDQLRARIFEPFFTTKKYGKGTGLGLAVVHTVVNRFGGSIKVDTAPGRGASFIMDFAPGSISLALETSPPATHPGLLSTEPVARRSRPVRRVLVVDDHEDVRSAVARLASSLGYEAYEATGGLHALKTLEQLTVDVVLADVTMPDMGGIELAQEIRLMDQAPEVVLMSGYPTHILEKHQNLEPGTACLEKPVSRDALKFVLGSLGSAESAPTVRH